MLTVLLAIVGAIVALGLIVSITLLTINAIKKYRQRKNSKIVAADMEDLLKAAAKDPNINRVKLEDLDEECETVIAEYDEENDEIIKYDGVKESDGAVRNLLNKNNGVVILED